MSTPPRNIEALLGALGAEPSFRESVLGDLMEEFAARIDRDGEDCARRWYRREALRTAPHLLRNGWHRARRDRLGRLLGIFVTAYAGVFIVGIIPVGITFGALRALGLFREPLRLYAGDWRWQASMLALGALSTTFGGYLAAWLGEEGPLFTAFAFGVVWSSLEAIGLTLMRGALPVWYLAALPMVILAGTSVGGILRVRQTSRGDVPPLLGRSSIRE